MSTPRLATHQKRIKDLTEAFGTYIQDPKITAEIKTLLGNYQSALTACWEKGQVSPESEAELADFDRQITALHEEARLRVIPKGYREKHQSAAD